MLVLSNRSKAKRLKLTKPVIIIGVEIYWTVGSIPRTSILSLVGNKGISCNFPLLNDRHRKWRDIKRVPFAQFQTRKTTDN